MKKESWESSKEEYNRIRKLIEPVWGKTEAVSITYRLMEHCYKLDRTDILADKEFKSTRSCERFLFEAVKRLDKMEPVQYITGFSSFCGIDLFVNKNVLIPRPETEEMVHLIVSENNIEKPSIVDIGTGSGCIAIALATLIEGADVTATDNEKNIMKIARRNAVHNRVVINLYQTDILRDDIPGMLYDIIVSNPPYVLQKEREMMKKNVLFYEPGSAIFVPDDNPLIFYTIISKKSRRKLKHHGRLYFEINESYGKDITELLINDGYKDVKLFKDINGKNRVVRAVNN